MASLNYHRAISVLRRSDLLLLHLQRSPLRRFGYSSRLGGRGHMDRLWTLGGWTTFPRGAASTAHAGKRCLAHWYPDGRRPPPCNYPCTAPLAAAPQIAALELCGHRQGRLKEQQRLRSAASSPGSPTFIDKQSCCGGLGIGEQTREETQPRGTNLSDHPASEEEEPEGARRRRGRRHGDGEADIL